jgi:prepilin-type N-terminal cleavage/methylation domain-containing protein
MNRPFFSRAFTLLEVILSMAILAMLAASVYAIVSSSISASKIAMEQQLTLRRLDSFLRVTRDAFVNLPGRASVFLEIAKSSGGQPEPRLVLGNVQGLFGMPSLGGGTLVLAARPRSDGTRTITMLRIPPNCTDRELEAAYESPGIPLLPKARKPTWSFQSPGAGNDWKIEWPQGSPRPSLVRLQFEMNDLPDPIEAVFQVPEISPPAQDQSTSTNSTNSPSSIPPGSGQSSATSPQKNTSPNAPLSTQHPPGH